jgi:CheY-like chemotaxis protein
LPKCGYDTLACVRAQNYDGNNWVNTRARQAYLSSFQKCWRLLRQLTAWPSSPPTIFQSLSAQYFWRAACSLPGMADRLLIVDDDEQLARGYSEHFTQMGYQVDCARELEEAETLLAFFPYAVVITDLRLSKLGFGGLDLVKYIRDQSLPSRIIVLTGYAWPEIKAEAMTHRVDAFLQKPLRLQEVADKVKILAGGEA